MLNAHILFCLIAVGQASSSDPATDAVATKSSTSELLPQSTPIPKHLLYTHFLHMVNDLDKKATDAGLAIPPLPLELHQLQAERTALTISHVLDLQAELGKEKTRRLEGYFQREVTPRVSLKVLAHPPADPKTP
jgi:hypothetical protein